MEIILTSLLIFGIKFCFSDGQIFGKLKEKIRQDIPKKYRNNGDIILKPIINCPPCMGSVWGTIMYFILQPDMYWLIFIVSVTGLNALLMKFWEW